MSIIISRAKDSFWKIHHPKGVTENPLVYRCAPNAADASYAGAETIEDFIAYGFKMSWLSPDDFSMWDSLERYDIQWLRESFLRTLEDTLQCLYKGNYELEEGKPFTDFEYNSDNSLNINNSDEGDGEELMLNWMPTMIGTDGCIGFDLVCSVLASKDPKATGGEPITIFLDKEGYKNQARVRAAIAMARLVNNLPIGDNTELIHEEPSQTKAWWDELKVAVPDFRHGVPKTCIEFQRWVKQTEFADLIEKLMSE